MWKAFSVFQRDMPNKRRQGRKSSAKNNAKPGDKAQKPGDTAQKQDDKAQKPGNTALKEGDVLEEATEEQSPKVSFRDMTEAVLSGKISR